MKFFETDKQFHMLVEGETAPKDCATYEFGFYRFPSVLMLPTLDLKIRCWVADRPISYEMTFTYKGLPFRANKIGSTPDSLLLFLNDLKAGNHDKKLKEIIRDSFKTHSTYCVNACLNNISSNHKKIEELEEQIRELQKQIQ